jgi:hypothetical protein
LKGLHRRRWKMRNEEKQNYPSLLLACSRGFASGFSDESTVTGGEKSTLCQCEATTTSLSPTLSHRHRTRPRLLLQQDYDPDREGADRGPQQSNPSPLWPRPPKPARQGPPTSHRFTHASHHADRWGLVRMTGSYGGTAGNVGWTTKRVDGGAVRRLE